MVLGARQFAYVTTDADGKLLRHWPQFAKERTKAYTDKAPARP